MIPAVMRKGTAIFVSFCVACQAVLPNIVHAQTLSRGEYEDCQTQSEADFRKAIKAITLAALKNGTAGIDYNALVRDQWRLQKIDDVVDTQVDLAMSEVRSETSWSELLKSLAYSDNAKKLAVAMAERVYRSDKIKTALQTMAVDAGREIGKFIEITTADAEKPAQQCLQAFLGPRYGRTVASAVMQDTSAAFVVSPDNATSSASSTAIATNASGAIAGAIILLVRRQLTRMAQRLGQRVVGAVLGRLVAIVAGGIGVVLIAKDAWDLRYGVLPIIADEMKSEATKEKVREELALAIEQQISNQIETLADSASTRIIEIWREFKQAHLKVLSIAETNPRFKEFIETARPDQLARVDEVVAIILRNGDDGDIDRMIKDGTLHRAVVQMPDAGLQIARETNSIDTALSWWTLAGDDRLEEVVRFALHKKMQPEHFTLQVLQRLLDFDDKVIIDRLSATDRKSLATLFDLKDDQIKRLARELPARQLVNMADYMTGLGQSARQKVISTIVETPSRMSVLDAEYVKQGVLDSSDQISAVTMILRENQGLDLNVIRSDFALAWGQKISPVLIWNKHPFVIISGGIVILFLLLVLRRILFAPRRRAASNITGKAKA